MTDYLDPRRGMFPTGPSTPTATRPLLSFGTGVPTMGSTSNGPTLSYGNTVPTLSGGFLDFFTMGNSSNLVFGETVTAGGAPGTVQTAGGFVRGDVDGQAGWQNLFAGASAALLEGIGGRRDAPAPQLQQAGFLQRPADISPTMLLVIAAALGTGIYFLAK